MASLALLSPARLGSISTIGILRGKDELGCSYAWFIVKMIPTSTTFYEQGTEAKCYLESDEIVDHQTVVLFRAAHLAWGEAWRLPSRFAAPADPESIPEALSDDAPDSEYVSKFDGQCGLFACAMSPTALPGSWGEGTRYSSSLSLCGKCDVSCFRVRNLTQIAPTMAT